MSPWNRPTRARAGFTLLEVMVAVAVLAIALVALLGAQSLSLSRASETRFSTTAALLARQQLTVLTLADFSALTAAEGDFGEDYPGYRWRLETEEIGEEETGLPGVSSMLKMIILTVILEGEEALRYEIRQIMMRPLEP